MKNLFVCPKIEDKEFPFKWKGCEIFLINMITQIKYLNDWDWSFRREFNGRKTFCVPIGAITTLSENYQMELFNGDVLMLYVENLKFRKIYNMDVNSQKQKDSKQRKIKAYEDKQRKIKDQIWNDFFIKLDEFWSSY